MLDIPFPVMGNTSTFPDTSYFPVTISLGMLSRMSMCFLFRSNLKQIKVWLVQLIYFIMAELKSIQFNSY